MDGGEAWREHEQCTNRKGDSAAPTRRRAEEEGQVEEAGGGGGWNHTIWSFGVVRVAVCRRGEVDAGAEGEVEAEEVVVMAG